MVSRLSIKHKFHPAVAGVLIAMLILAACTPAQVGSTAGTLAAAAPTTASSYYAQPTQAVPVTGDSTPEAAATAIPTEAVTATPVAAASPAADDSAELKVSQTAELGSFLVDQNGKTLYLFTKDEPGVSNCAGECLVNWPPYKTVKPPKADDGVDQAKLGTITLADGSLQVTYNGWPLYYFIGDQKAGDVAGQNVGEVWFVVPPTGEASATGSSTTSVTASASDDSAEIKVSQTDALGKFLVSGGGLTLYTFSKDKPGVSNCSGQCLVNWPPFLTGKAPKADDGVDQSKLGTIKLADGSLQVTYNQMPLYYFIGDKNPGDVNGQNVGGVWFVQAP